MTIEQALALAKESQLAGDLPAAAGLYGRVLAERPDEPGALFGVGILAMQQGRLGDAVQWLGRATDVAPGEFRHHFALGQALADLKSFDRAAAAFRSALAIRRDSADAHFSLGLALQSKGDLPGAIAAYRDTLSFRPDFAPALSNLGAALRAFGDVAGAIEALHEAVRIEPGVAAHRVNLGAALSERRRFDEAVAVLQHASELDPTSAQAVYNLGVALQGAGRPREAVDAYRRAIELRPAYADAYNNLGTACKELGEFQAAAAAFEAAIRACPESPVAYNNAGCLLRTRGRLEEAEDVLRQGVALGGSGASAAALHNNLASVLKDSGSLDEAIALYRRALELDPADAAIHSNLVYSLFFQATDGQSILDECRRWNAAHAAPLRPRAGAIPCRDEIGAIGAIEARRIRVGYVSGDFRDHCQSLFTIPLLSHHDRTRFEIYCYASVERPDDFTRRIAGLVDVWRDCRALDDAGVAERIRADGIDVLVDLGMHMATARPLVFARRPAPVQVAWLAYPGTTGIGTIDYRLTDPRLDPPGADEQYTERSIRLPHTFWCYDPLSSVPVGDPLPAQANGFVTFGCLNNPCKLTDRTLAMWAAVMRAVPDSRLILMVAPGRPQQRLAARLAAQGIEAGRVAFRAFRPRDQYLRTYHEIDVGLDTFPYNGHTTSLDALWMRVPVVTRIGATAVGRGGLSQLFNLGLCELAADSDEQFVEAAVALSRDLARLAELRRTLRGRMERSPLMDAARFAADVEGAYLRILGTT